MIILKHGETEDLYSEMYRVFLICMRSFRGVFVLVEEVVNQISFTDTWRPVNLWTANMYM